MARCLVTLRLGAWLRLCWCWLCYVTESTTQSSDAEYLATPPRPRPGTMPPRTSRHAAAAPDTSAEPRRPHGEHFYSRHSYSEPYYSRYSEPYYRSYNDEHGSEQRSRYSERRSRLDRGDCFCNKNTTKTVFSSTQRSQQNMLALPPNQHSHEMHVTRDQPPHVPRDRMQQQHVYEGFRPVGQHQQLYQVRGLSLTRRPTQRCMFHVSISA